MADNEEREDDDFENDPLAKRAYWLMEQHPICQLLTRLASRHERHKRMVRLQVPAFIIEKEQEMVRQALDELAAAVPVNAQIEDGPRHTIAYTVAAMRGEIVEGIKKDPEIPDV